DGHQVYGRVVDGAFYSEDGSLRVSGSHVEHGRTLGDGSFEYQRTVEGRALWGSDTSDGGWMTSDHKVWVDKDQVAHHGITDPGTGQFLENGEVRTIDGRQVYGSVQDGVFFSEDRDVMVTGDGTVEHGFTDSGGRFHAERTVDGQALYGSVTQDGGWLSDNGKVWVDKDQVVHHGITDPGTGQFLENGEVRTIDGRQVYGSVQDGVFFSEDRDVMVTGDGTVEHGFTDSDGRFHAERTVDGQALYGSVTQDGGWLSDNGKVWVDKDQVAHHGITDPGTGQFLENGEVRTIDGRQVYGSVQDGVFFSEDRDLMVTADGTVEHGYTDSDGRFHAERTIDGKTMYGSVTQDGGWISDDGTVAEYKDGSIHHGLVDPTTNQFVENGIKYTLPDGTVMYGTMIGKDFLSADLTTLVLQNGTVVHGTLDTDTGIFTPAGSSGAAAYVLTDDGAIYGTKRDADGAYVLDNGQVVMTPGAWAIDLAQLEDAIKLTKSKLKSIEGHIETINQQYASVRNVWSSPAGDTFGDVSKKAGNGMDKCQQLLAEIAARMQTSYDNYLAAESANLRNVTP
ncbi:WXG100 family type VII secretion target, partial [Streptomyces sp. NPDC048281]|uniref:WXG100 family type VII secretion target n=1 Tax=Streptomyces sp. NPDC048281 TaxID=3154715 RepID=UPI00341AA61C